MNIDDNVERVLAFLRQYKGSRRALAASLGISEAAIRYSNRNDWNPTANTLRKLESVIPADFMPQDGVQP